MKALPYIEGPAWRVKLFAHVAERFAPRRFGLPGPISHALTSADRDVFEAIYFYVAAAPRGERLARLKACETIRTLGGMPALRTLIDQRRRPACKAPASAQDPAP